MIDICIDVFACEILLDNNRIRILRYEPISILK